MSAWGWKGQGCEQGTRVHTNRVQVGNKHRDVGDNCRAIKEALARNKIGIDQKERGLGPSGPRCEAVLIGCIGWWPGSAACAGTDDIFVQLFAGV